MKSGYWGGDDKLCQGRQQFNFLRTSRILTWELIASAWCLSGKRSIGGRGREALSRPSDIWTSAGGECKHRSHKTFSSVIVGESSPEIGEGQWPEV